MQQLSPLEEALFQTWARAHGVEDHDDPENQFDYRDLYKQSNGRILPGNFLRSLASKFNLAMQPQEGGEVNMADPYAAQAEMMKAQLDAKTKSQSDMLKMQLEEKKMQHKLLIEQLKMQHQSAEKEKDRQMKAQQAQAQAEARAQQQQQQMAMHQQDQAMNRQFQLEDRASDRQFQMEDQAMQAQTQPDPMQGQALPQQDQGGQSLESILMGRALGPS